jgi:signal transduction histidine kinase
MTVEGLGAIEGWHQIRDVWRRPVIVLCAKGDDAGAAAALADGAEDAIWREDPGVSLLLARAISRATARGRTGTAAERPCIQEMDVTAQRALEERVRRAQQWEAIGLLAGGIAHDFNNLLCVITAAASTAAGWMEREAPAAAEFEEIRQAAARAAELTRKLLTLGRKQPLTMEYLDAAELISDFASLMRRTLGDGIEVVVACDRPLPIRGDRLQIEQVLLNVCTNARQAMQGRGRLEVEGRCRKGAQGQAGAGEPVVEIAVRDTGPGMDEATRRRIFEPFFTTKPDGSGLGMTVSGGIVQHHGGSMEVESQPGKGTVVTLRFPRCEEPADAPARCDRPAPVEAAPLRILVAEDEAPLRRLVCRILRDGGYDAVPAADGPAAVATFAEDPRGIALVILDVRLPRMSGPAAYRQMAAQRPGLPVLFVSGHAPDSAGIPPGSPLLLKPFANTALLSAVRNAATLHAAAIA